MENAVGGVAKLPHRANTGNGTVLGKDPYQGIASAMPPRRKTLNGFSRRGLTVMA
jgi:hypothetical protein